MYILKSNFLKQSNLFWNEDRWIQTYFSQYKYWKILHHWLKNLAMISLQIFMKRGQLSEVSYWCNLFPRRPKSFLWKNKLFPEFLWCSLVLTCIFYECYFSKDVTIYFAYFYSSEYFSLSWRYSIWGLLFSLSHSVGTCIPEYSQSFWVPWWIYVPLSPGRLKLELSEHR